MPSPFPGMNPYLEQPDVWHDFHQRFVPRIGDAITELIRPNYVTKIDENVYLHELSMEQRLLLGRPDVSVLNGNRHSSTSVAVSSAAVPRALGKLLPSVDRIAEPFIEIRDTEYRDLITVIELLSPTNKRSGADREQYLAKRRLLIAGNVNYVEIDLLRGDARMPVEGLSDCHYCVMVCRSHRRPEVELWPMALREPLPRIPIPLKPEHADAVLDLQSLLNQQYDAAGYDDYIYGGQPRPPLYSDDDIWAKSIIAAKVGLPPSANDDGA